MKIKTMHNVPIGGYRAVERREEYSGDFSFISGSLVYLRNGFNYHAIAMEEITEIDGVTVKRGEAKSYLENYLKKAV